MDVPFTRYQYSYSVDREFTLDTPEALYYVVFNYDKSKAYSKTADLARIGVDPANVKSVKELWTGQGVNVAGQKLNVSVPQGDVRLYRIEKKQATGIAAVAADGGSATVSYGSGSLAVKASGAVASLSVYDLQGLLMARRPVGGGAAEASLPLSCAPGVYLVKVALESGRTVTKKLFIG